MPLANWLNLSANSNHRLSIVLAYHGCTIETARALLGGSPFEPSNNKIRLARCWSVLLGVGLRSRIRVG
jgi:hypothetical protein